MKNYIKTIAVITIVSILFLACSNKIKRNANFLPPLKITITDEIKGNVELVDMIKSSEAAINEFSDNIEQLALDGQEVLSKKEEDQTLIDNIKMGQLLLEFASNSNQMVETFEKFNIYIEVQNEQGKISEKQLQALEQIVNVFNARMKKLNKKYKNYFNQ
jgi:hypothetical protein